ncbi:hypothetical protein K449DRAFT_462854 [Hypoxylon sp. EC38]|nr:hypothetical protein K449DRAFT_462854 [Hypoxylon sp. EC38]
MKPLPFYGLFLFLEVLLALEYEEPQLPPLLDPVWRATIYGNPSICSQTSTIDDYYTGFAVILQPLSSPPTNFPSYRDCQEVGQRPLGDVECEFWMHGGHYRPDPCTGPPRDFQALSVKALNADCELYQLDACIGPMQQISTGDVWTCAEQNQPLGFRIRSFRVMRLELLIEGEYLYTEKYVGCI